MVTPEEVRRVAGSIPDVSGWDFSAASTAHDPTPWRYTEVVRRFCSPSSRVLDIGTGGGERFLSLVPRFKSGIGTDASPAMIETARRNMPADLRTRVRFEVMPAQQLHFSPRSFDLVLDRHAPVFVDQIVPLLRPGGYFITQQVAGRNLQSIWATFGWGSCGDYWHKYWREHGLPAQDVGTLARHFQEAGCDIVSTGEYDVAFYFKDLASLLFHLKALHWPEPFDVEKHADSVARLIAAWDTERGIASNQHRTLLIVRRPVR